MFRGKTDFETEEINRKYFQKPNLKAQSFDKS